MKVIQEKEINCIVSKTSKNEGDPGQVEVCWTWLCPYINLAL